MDGIGTPPTSFSSALVVDDHPLFCDALAMTLRSVAGVGSVETAGSLAQALERLGGGASPGLVVLDLNLPDVDGVDGLMRMRAAASVPVLVVSSMSDDRVIASVMAAGASGFVPKHSRRDVFRAALDALAAGRSYLPEGYVASAQDPRSEAGTRAAARLASLTGQQTRILELICEGKLNKQIAYDLSIAETTVKAHVTAIMRKLGVQSRTQAVLMAGEARFETLRHGA
jgi:DNA-binding NarL/FixJ family response regulator